MVKKFTYTVDNDVQFTCELASRQCSSHVKSGARCKRRCVIGLPCCWSHLSSDHKLKIKKSLIPNTNMSGLFAWEPKAQGQPVFRKGDTIITYTGETLTKDQLDGRYDEFTSPYGVQISANRYIDAACHRGVAALINSGKSPSTNCAFSLYAREQIMNIKATKNIAHGSELLISYGNTYKLHEDGISHRTK